VLNGTGASIFFLFSIPGFSKREADDIQNEWGAKCKMERRRRFHEMTSTQIFLVAHDPSWLDVCFFVHL
jgi:hypothetical protein